MNSFDCSLQCGTRASLKIVSIFFLIYFVIFLVSSSFLSKLCTSIGFHYASTSIASPDVEPKVITVSSTSKISLILSLKTAVVPLANL